MKPRFRQSMNWLHTWTGFSFGWLLYFIFLTGTTGYFENEIDRWMKPEASVVNTTINQDEVITIATEQLEVLATDSPQWYISFPASRSPFINIQWLQLADEERNIKRDWHEKNIDIEQGSAKNVRETAGGETLYRMHYNLHYVPKLVGYIITSLASMLMLIALITGVIIHKKIFIEFFTFRPKKGLRSWLDVHNIFSVLPLPFHLMITYSGLLLLMGVTMSSVIDFRYGEGKINHKKFYNEAQLDIKEQQRIELASDNLSLISVYEDASSRFKGQNISFIGHLERGAQNEHFEIWFDKYEGIHLVSAVEYRQKDGYVEIEISKGKAGPAARIYDLFEHLHEGLFADIYLRWLYFISGLMGSAMIATGSILWIKKRKNNVIEHSKFSLISIVERVNIGIILGLPVSIACYFASNRLLPISLIERAEWEVNSFFITLIACIVFCLFKTKKLWQNMLWLTALSYLVLPLINLLTTKHSLMLSLNNNDWLMLGFDLSMLVFGFIFAGAAIKYKRHESKNITDSTVLFDDALTNNKLKDVHL